MAEDKKVNVVHNTGGKNEARSRQRMAEDKKVNGIKATHKTTHKTTLHAYPQCQLVRGECRQNKVHRPEWFCPEFYHTNPHSNENI